MKIWIDADACPSAIKEIVFRASQRLQLHTYLVANHYLKVPKDCSFVSMVCVPKGFDVADDYIAQNLDKNDLVITADVPLAYIIVEKGAIAINPRGEAYTTHNISEKRSIRDFMQTMREGGLIQGGPSHFNEIDKKKFASTFDRHVQIILKRVV